MKLPIDMDILQKRREIPIKLAELSYKDKDQAIILMRKWGEKKTPISELHEKISSQLR